MRVGVRLGVDVGTVRIGVSRCDPHGLLATPLETVPRSKGADVRRILELASEHEAVELVVGLPLALSGRRTASTEDAAEFAQRLAEEGTVPVRMVDERLSTVSAQSALRSAGKRSRAARPVIDQAAATIILQHALDAERQAGSAPGTPIPPSIGRIP